MEKVAQWELHNLYNQADQVKEKGGQGMWHAWDERKVRKLLVGRPEGKRPLGRLKHRSEDRIRMDLRETGWGGGGGGGVDSLGSGWQLVAGSCECGDEHLGSGTTELVVYSARHSSVGCVLVFDLLYSLS
jgi:hypothetical protein